MWDLAAQITARNELETYPFIAIISSSLVFLQKNEQLEARCSQLLRQTTLGEEVDRYNAAEEGIVQSVDEPDGKGRDTPVPFPSPSSRSSLPSFFRSNGGDNKDFIDSRTQSLASPTSTNPLSPTVGKPSTAVPKKSDMYLAALQSQLLQSSLLTRKTAGDLASLKSKHHEAQEQIGKLEGDLEEGMVRGNVLEDEGFRLTQVNSILKQENQKMRAESDHLRADRDKLKLQEDDIVTRMVTDKQALSNEMNHLTEIIERQNKELVNLRGLVTHSATNPNAARAPPLNPDGSYKTLRELAGLGTPEEEDLSAHRVAKTHIPQNPLLTFKPHTTEINSLKFDPSNPALLITASSDSTVKILSIPPLQQSVDHSTGKLRGSGSGVGLREQNIGASTQVKVLLTIRSPSASPLLSLDVWNSTLLATTDVNKSCTVYKISSSNASANANITSAPPRPLHQLLSHAQPVTSCKFLTFGKNIITCSQDRTFKLWDIARTNYTLLKTTRDTSIFHSLDVSNPAGGTSVAVSAMTGHADGGVRFWDVRTGGKTAEIGKGLHDRAVTSVAFDSVGGGGNRVLSVGRDNSLHLSDVRTCRSFLKLEAKGFKVPYNWSNASWSPCGKFVVCGGEGGGMFVWRVESDGGPSGEASEADDGFGNLGGGRTSSLSYPPGSETGPSNHPGAVVKVLNPLGGPGGSVGSVGWNFSTGLVVGGDKSGGVVVWG